MVVVVLGMHRSGTSAIAKGIVELGAFPGNHLMGAREDNPKGFWEDERIVALNDEILGLFDLKWDSIDNPVVNRFNKLLPLFEKNYLPRAMELVEDLFRVSDMVMIKDPRMCVLLPFWQKVFNIIGADVKYILALRDPLESAQSLEKRNKMDIKYGLNLWLYYNSMVFQNIKSDFLVCSIQSLIEDPMNELKRIGHFIGSPVDEQLLQEYCNNFLDAALLHHKARVLDTGNQYGDLRVFRALLKKLTEWSYSGKRSYEEANALYAHYRNEIITYLGWGSELSLNDYLTITVADQEGSTVTRSYPHNPKEEINVVNFSLEEGKSIKELYLIPSKYACTLKVHYIRFTNKKEIKGYTSLAGDFSCNANNVYIFESENSTLNVGLPKGEFSSVIIGYEVHLLERYTYYYLNNNKIVNLLRQQEQIEELNRELQEIQGKVELLSRELAAKEEEIHKLAEEREWMKENLAEKKEEIEKLTEEREWMKINIAEKNEEIEKLSRWGSSLDQELQAIYRSNGWKLLLILYKIRNGLFPEGSKRRLFFSLAVYFLFRPKQFFRSLSVGNVKLFINKMKTDPPEVVMHKVKQKSSVYAGADEVSAAIEVMNGTGWENRRLAIPAFDQIDVSIIIPAYNQFEYNMNCIQAIIKNTKHVRYEIILVDDVSTDETAEIEHKVDNLRVLRNRENQGFLINCNNGAKLAKGKYLLFLNNDTQVQNNWLEPLVRLIESDDRIGMVGSKLVYPDGRLQEAGGIIWKDASGWNYGRLDHPEKPDFNYVKEVDYISGACIMIRADLWKEIGGFDSRYAPAYYEDADLAFEVRRRGYKVMYQPQSVVVHFEGISNGTDLGTGIKSYQVKNREKFLEKWSDVLAAYHFPNAEHVFWARDRSRVRKTILVIDHHVPHYDQDAGSRFTFHYLKLFVEMGFHVVFIGDNFYKHEPYTTTLEQLGIQVLYGNWYAGRIKAWLQENGSYIDYVYLNRPHISVKYIDLVKKLTKAKIVYFGHDLHYLRELRNYEVEGKKELLESSNYWKKIEFKLFEEADVIHTVSSYEKEIIEKEFPGKVVRHIPLYIYERNFNEDKEFDFDKRKGLLFVGGFNHKPNVDGVLWFARHVFPEIVSQQPDITFTIVGSNPPEQIQKLHSERIRVTGYVTDEELIQFYNNSRMVVVPLRFGAGVKGKVVEAMYHQVPVVTTSIGAEGLVDIEQYVRIADQEQDFGTKVLELYNDKEQWEHLARKSREYIISHFSKEAAREVIEKDLRPMDVSQVAHLVMSR